MRYSVTLRSADWQFVADVAEQPTGPIFKAQTAKKIACPLKMGPVGFAETTLLNYQSTLHKIPEESGFLFMASCGLDSVLLTEGRILNLFYEI